MDIIVLPAAKEMGIRFAKMACILKCLPSKSRGCVSHCMHELQHIIHEDDENHSGESDDRMDGHMEDEDYEDDDSMFEDYEEGHNVHDDYYDDNESDEFKQYYHDDRDDDPAVPTVTTVPTVHTVHTVPTVHATTLNGY